MTHIETSSKNTAAGRDESSKLVALMNAALVGVPAAYAVSGSLLVTGLAALLAGLVVLAYLARRRRR